MYGKVKLTKRQIKEDKFTTFMLNAKHQFMENWQYYIMGVAIVILVIVAVVYYANSQAAKQQEASERFSRALLDYRNGSAEVALLGLNEILTEYPDGEVADQTTFLLAKINFEDQNYPEAMRYFEMYTNKFKSNDLRRASAYGGVAACYENQGDFLEAARRFVVAINEYPDGPLAADYSLSAMRDFLKGGDIESARAQFETIKEKYENTALEDRAVRLFNEYANI